LNKIFYCPSIKPKALFHTFIFAWGLRLFKSLPETSIKKLYDEILN
jgi:hypothetical protein